MPFAGLTTSFPGGNKITFLASIGTVEDTFGLSETNFCESMGN